MNNNQTSIDINKNQISYYNFKKITSELFLFPLLFYVISLSLIIHVSLFNQPLKSQINLYSSKKRKILFIILIFLYILQMLFLLYTLPDNNYAFNALITLLFYLTSILAVIITIYFIEEKNKKQIKLEKINPLNWFIFLNIIYFFLDLINEIVYGYYSILTVIIFIYCIYFSLFFNKFPDDECKFILNKGFKYIELCEFDKELLNERLQNLRINNEKKIKKKHKNIYYIPMTYINSKNNRLGEANYEEQNSTYNENNFNASYNFNLLYNGLNNGLNEINRNSSLRSSLENTPLKIEINFCSNFDIDYGNYYNYNKTKNDNSNISKLKNKTLEFLRNKIKLLSNEDIIDYDFDHENHFEVANFYTSIIFSFNLSATSPLYVTNKFIRRSLEEFFKLDLELEKEYTEEKYSRSIIKKLPRLNIKQVFNDLLSNKNKSKGSYYNTNILLECILNSKTICEKYLNEIITQPYFITQDVLFFLDIRDENVGNVYYNIRYQILKKKTLGSKSAFNPQRYLSSIFDNNCLTNSCNYFSNTHSNNEINLNITKGNYVESENEEESNTYLLLIRLTKDNCIKIIRKKLDETIFILQEFYKISKNMANTDKKSKNVENFKEINENFNHLETICKIINDSTINNTINFYTNNIKSINSSRRSSIIIRNNNNKYFIPFSEEMISSSSSLQKFSLKDFYFDNTENNDEFILNYIDNYFDCDSNIEKDNNVTKYLIYTTEKILSLIINFFEEEIGSSNQMLKNFFIEFYEDYWYADKLQKYVKNNTKILNLFQFSINDDDINNIFSIEKNYLFINENYKFAVFYEICLKITTTLNFIELNKKYTFEEIKNYIDVMNIELNLEIKWPDKCFNNKDSQISSDEINNIHIIRLYFINKFLNMIFKSKNLYKSLNWKKILSNDITWNDIINIKFKELKYQEKLKNENNKNDLINIKNFLKNIKEEKTNNFELNNNSESQFSGKSIESANSQTSQNSNIKKLFDT